MGIVPGLEANVGVGVAAVVITAIEGYWGDAARDADDGRPDGMAPCLLGLRLLRSFGHLLNDNIPIP
jgi:hypothetical protein